ncbi:uncharacterized protein EV422DRAFT_548211 [Fimicolochytrium jonesii]|uniref:uncharacterized protein n=1 Tax=Fimicolochytrium jonesii TaxID=1396493 RepID=UPI0022FE17A1|nr:uncharacterized protein EV422DRAFT_548211 [Fimicolochytrium jonesii]KAI8815737.1 hypothetical protein EV422DRAFT_548211 [Fimicolochytrium jonesii]
MRTFWVGLLSGLVPAFQYTQPDLPLAKVGQSFSKWNLAQVKRYYQIRSLPREDEFQKLQFRVPLPKSLISRMMIAMDDASYSLGDLREGKEIKKVFATFSVRNACHFLLMWHILNCHLCNSYLVGS